ncbi:hypothetical protein MBEHAL_1475 [Halarchaeum acidiphilum MH1-52-1]|uniref:Uncharacterized protein n=1 Tax=Halarchaeum acidiphilum MH1-52-1 TaxID=1261545 RepID=U2YUL8_9EURY|nr:hypothetical protein [Halarchaeum acidiphilum]GAD52715.1 hypothetical protein MBEHAL_1475 [Halarchaeum acidiphilum MH1-52-1]
MAESIRGTVIHVIDPDDIDEHDLDPVLAERAAGNYVTVCRRGGSPSLIQRVWTVLRGGSIDAVTVVTDEAYADGDAIDVDAAPTELDGVYDAT